MLTQTPRWFIHNPHANRGASAAAVAAIRSLLSEGDQWHSTTGPGDATRFAIRAIEEGASTVVAVGGDGTIHEVISGIMSVDRAVRPRFGILPAGSGNDFAFSNGIPLDLVGALNVIDQNSVEPVDIGVATIGDREGCIFHNAAGIGFDARVTIHSRRFRTLHGFPLYLISTLSTLVRQHETFAIEFTLDDESFTQEALMLTLGNGPRQGGGFYTTPTSKIDDGSFELLLVKPISRLRMLWLLPKFLKGNHLGSKDIEYTPFTRLALHAKEPLAIHLDGEIYARTQDGIRDVEVHVEHAAIEVFRPAR